MTDQPARAVALEPALDELRNGGPVLLVHDDGGDVVGDLVMPAESVGTQEMLFLLRRGCGIVCAAMPAARLEELRIEPMTSASDHPSGADFMVSVASRAGRGDASAAARSATLRALADPSAVARDFARPGHVFPLRARDHGVLKRAGRTEAALDLVRLAERTPVAALSEVIADSGEAPTLEELHAIASAHGLAVVQIDDVIAHRMQRERLVRHEGAAELPSSIGTFTCHVFTSFTDGVEHVALSLGRLDGDQPPLVRVHSECLTGDGLGSLRCDCGVQLLRALEAVAEAGCGVVVYLRGQEGRGIGLHHKLRAYALQDLGSDTVEANEQLGLPVDSREYGIGAQMLVELGVQRMRLMTNNPAKYSGLDGFGLEITERVPLQAPAHEHNRRYLEAKRDKLGHVLDL